MKSFKHPLYREPYTMEDKFKEQHEPELTEQELKAKQIIVNEVDKALTLVKAHIREFGKEHGTETISISYVSAVINTVIGTYKKGAGLSDATQEEVEKIISGLTSNNEVKKDSVNDDLA